MKKTTHIIIGTLIFTLLSLILSFSYTFLPNTLFSLYFLSLYFCFRSYSSYSLYFLLVRLNLFFSLWFSYSFVTLILSCYSLGPPSFVVGARDVTYIRSHQVFPSPSCTESRLVLVFSESGFIELLLSIPSLLRVFLIYNRCFAYLFSLIVQFIYISCFLPSYLPRLKTSLRSLNYLSNPSNSY